MEHPEIKNWCNNSCGKSGGLVFPKPCWLHCAKWQRTRPEQERKKNNASKPIPKKVVFHFDKRQFLTSDFLKLASGRSAVHMLGTDDEHLYHGLLGVAHLVVILKLETAKNTRQRRTKNRKRRRGQQGRGRPIPKNGIVTFLRGACQNKFVFQAKKKNSRILGCI